MVEKIRSTNLAGPLPVVDGPTEYNNAFQGYGIIGNNNEP
jgi:hypothetical protein